jgi:hypothetical protein
MKPMDPYSAVLVGGEESFGAGKEKRLAGDNGIIEHIEYRCFQWLWT